MLSTTEPISDLLCACGAMQCVVATPPCKARASTDLGTSDTAESGPDVGRSDGEKTDSQPPGAPDWGPRVRILMRPAATQPVPMCPRRLRAVHSPERPP